MRVKSRENSQIISVNGLTKQFGSINAINGFQGQIKKGEIFSLLGPNGAGKSTVVRILTTILTPDSGNIHINGISIKKSIQNNYRGIS